MYCSNGRRNEKPQPDGAEAKSGCVVQMIVDLAGVCMTRSEGKATRKTPPDAAAKLWLCDIALHVPASLN